MDQLIPWLALLAAGLIVTAELTVISAVLTVALSTLLAVAAISPWRAVRVPVRLYIDAFRSIPQLALLLFLYFGLGHLATKIGVGSFGLAVLGLVMSESAYLSEVYRGGLLAIPTSQWEAATSLGLPWHRIMRLVILPQAVPASVPGTVNMVIQLIKGSSLASLITVQEVTLAATLLVSQTFEPMSVYVLLGCMYLALIIPLTLLAGWVSRALREEGLRQPRVTSAARMAQETLR